MSSNVLDIGYRSITITKEYHSFGIKNNLLPKSDLSLDLMSNITNLWIINVILGSVALFHEIIDNNRNYNENDYQ
jgi:hypothetical protein